MIDGPRAAEPAQRGHHLDTDPQLALANTGHNLFPGSGVVLDRAGEHLCVRGLDERVDGAWVADVGQRLDGARVGQLVEQRRDGPRVPDSSERLDRGLPDRDGQLVRDRHPAYWGQVAPRPIAQRFGERVDGSRVAQMSQRNGGCDPNARAGVAQRGAGGGEQARVPELFDRPECGAAAAFLGASGLGDEMIEAASVVHAMQRQRGVESETRVRMAAGRGQSITDDELLGRGSRTLRDPLEVFVVALGQVEPLGVAERVQCLGASSTHHLDGVDHALEESFGGAGVSEGP